MRKLKYFVMLATVVSMLVGMSCQTGAMDLAPFEEANINWRQFEGTELLVGMNVYAGQRILESMLGDFERLTGIKVTFYTTQEVALGDKLTMDLSTGTGKFDAFNLALWSIPPWGKRGWLENVYPYVDDPQLTDKAWYDMEDFYPTFVDIGRGNDVALPFKWGRPDQLYGVPLDAMGTILFYRKDLLQKYGVPVPTTREEMHEVGIKLTRDEDGDGEIDTYGLTIRAGKHIGMITGQWLDMLYSYGGSYFDEQWNPMINSDAGVESLKIFKELVRDCSPLAVTNWGFPECFDFFAGGGSALYQDVSIFYRDLNDPSISKVIGKLGYAPGVGGPAGIKLGAWGWTLGMNSFSKNKKAAWLFIQWATSKPTALAGLMETGTPRKSIASHPRYTEFFPKDFSEAVDIGLGPEHLAHWFAPIIPEAMELMDILAGKLSEGVLGVKPPKQALDEAAAGWLRVMEKAGYYR